MRYELLYYELKERKFNSKKAFDKFCSKLTSDQKLRGLRKENKIYYPLSKDFYGNFVEVI